MDVDLSHINLAATNFYFLEMDVRVKSKNTGLAGSDYIDFPYPSGYIYSCMK